MGLNVELLEQSFKAITPKADALVNRFYERLFQKYPSVKPLFKDASMAEQKKKLLASLVLVIQNLRKPDKLTETLQAMGARHVGYGALPAHYDAVGENLLAVLAEFAGPAWTPAVKQAWTEAYGAIKIIMLQGAANHSVAARRPVGAPQRLSRTPTQPSHKPLSTQSSQEGRVMFAWFGNLKTVTKLMIGFALTGSIMAVVGAVGLSSMGKMNLGTKAIYESNLMAVKVLAELRGRAHQVRGNVIQHIAAPTAEEKVEVETRIKKLDGEIADRWPIYEPLISSPVEKEGYAKYREAWTGYLKARDEQTLPLSREGKDKQAYQVMKTDVAPKYKAVVEALSAIIEDNERQAKENFAQGQRLYQDSQTTLIGLIAGGIVLGLAMGWAIARLISNSLSNVLTAAQALGSGDLKARSSVTTKEEVGSLAQAFNEMGESLQKSVSKSQEMVCTLNNAQANLLMVDRNLVITYVNQGAMKTFRELDADIRKVLPKFDANKLVGTCIDDFHKDPLRIRRILDDPKNMPHRADIQIGPMTLDLMVDAIRTEDGTHTGNSLEWVNVTESRAVEQMVVRLKAAVENSTTNVILADETHNIIFANNASVAALRRIEPELRQVFAGFSVEQVLGGSIHRYHKDPQRIKTILEGLKQGDVHRGEIRPGSLIMDLSARAIFDAQGRKSAYMVEWRDVTSEKKAQESIAQLIQSAAKGHLSDRINADQMEGTYKLMSQNVNKLMEAVATPLNEAQTVLTALSQGDLRSQMTGAYEGEFEQMKTSLNSAIQNLTTTLSTVRTAAESVSTGAEQITRGNEDLSQRTSEQASSLEETSSAMEEMTSTVKQNADNAKQANQLAIAARDVAEKGGSVTTKAIDAMSEINKSSKKIADIITVIDEIAFQTNLLALNAAVEAARAGEHGRGFAVVAAEVRNLAQRSATAAKEIKGLINESVQRVTDGSELVDQSGKTLTEIVGSVKRVTDIIAEITAASQEQASGIDQVNKAIMQMDETTQQNAALVEEATSASQSMKEQAKELMTQVASFKINGNGSEGQARPGTVAHRPAQTMGSVKKPLFKKPAAPAQKPIAVGAGAAHKAKDEFEEF